MLKSTPEYVAAHLKELTREEPMLRKRRNRARQAVKGSIEINLDGLELGLTPEDITHKPDYANLICRRRDRGGHSGHITADCPNVYECSWRD